MKKETYNYWEAKQLLIDGKLSRVHPTDEPGWIHFTYDAKAKIFRDWMGAEIDLENRRMSTIGWQEWTPPEDILADEYGVKSPEIKETLRLLIQVFAHALSQNEFGQLSTPVAFERYTLMTRKRTYDAYLNCLRYFLDAFRTNYFLSELLGIQPHPWYRAKLDVNDGVEKLLMYER